MAKLVKMSVGRFVGLGLLAFALGGAACSEKIGEYAGEKIAEKAIESSGGKDVDVDFSKLGDKDAEMKFTNKETGESMTIKTGADYPPDVPSAFAQYPGSTVVSTMAASEGYTQVHMTTTDSPSQVNTYYADAAKKDGWKQTETMNMSGMIHTGYAKDKQKVMLMAAPQEEGSANTAITLMLTTEK